MRSILFAPVGLALITVPAILAAQDTTGPGSPPVSVVTTDGRVLTLNPEQQVIYDAWPVERQALYSTWPYDYRVYYWTLSPDQQTGYWSMTPDQRGMIYKMSPAQRAKAWSAIAQQAAGMVPTRPADQANPPGLGMPTTGVPAPQTAGQPVPPAMPADPSYQGGAYKGALTPPPASAMNKAYPVCTRKLQDNCQNPGEGGAPGRNRSLPYWPGKPASEGGR